VPTEGCTDLHLKNADYGHNKVRIMDTIPNTKGRQTARKRTLPDLGDDVANAPGTSYGSQPLSRQPSTRRVSGAANHWYLLTFRNMKC
jgi:hypothetical protein